MARNAVGGSSVRVAIELSSASTGKARTESAAGRPAIGDSEIDPTEVDSPEAETMWAVPGASPEGPSG